MSHPNPLHDRDNEYPFDEHSAGPSHSSFKSGMKNIRKSIQKVVGHKRRERHHKAKDSALMKMKAKSPHLDRSDPKVFDAQMGHRIDEWSKMHKKHQK